MSRIDYSDYTPELQKTARTSGHYEGVLKALTKCNFCDLKEKYIIMEKDDVVLSVNLFPYIDYQLIIIPRRHIKELLELKKEEWLAIRELSDLTIKLYKNFFDVFDVNLIYREGERSQKTVEHMHFNIIPFDEKLSRWNYQEIHVAPIEAAKAMREALEKVKSKYL